MKQAKGAWGCVLGILLLLVVGVLAGCGGDQGPPRTVVSGTVSFNGKPVAEGYIRFAPTFPAPTTGARITEGKYRADARGGVPVGKLNVQIEAFRKLTAAERGEAAAEGSPPQQRPPSSDAEKTAAPSGTPAAHSILDDHRVQWLPAKYNTETTLQFTIEPGSKEIAKDFNLTD